MPKKLNQYENYRDAVLKEYAEGKIVCLGFEGPMTMPLSEFIKQPADGILYDLNRSEEVVLTFIKDEKWVNDYAVAKVIKALKKEIDELKSKVK